MSTRTPAFPSINSITMRPSKRIARAVFAALVALAFGFVVLSSANAANESWQGNTSLNFATPANWSPAVTPSSGDTLSFGAAGSAGTALNNNLTARYDDWFVFVQRSGQFHDWRK